MPASCGLFYCLATGAPFWPNAEFWRLWLTAGLLCVLGCVALDAIGAAHAETCRVSFYGAESGRRTANGERFDPMGLTFAHRSWPFNTHARFCFHGRCAVARANDRGPFVAGRCADAARGLARAIGLEAAGVGNVTIERLD